MKKSIKKKDMQAVIIFVVLFMLFVSGWIVMYKIESAKVRLDENTLCPINKEVDNHTVVVIDKSDEWEKEAVDGLETFLYKIHQSIPEYGRLSFVVINGDKGSYTKAVKMFDMCNPGNGENCNTFFSNPRLLKKRYEESFSQPLKDIIKKLSTPDKAVNSPLFETIAGIIDADDSRHLKIHFVSDLMENGSKFNFYNIIPLAEQIVKEYTIDTDNSVSIYAHIVERRRHSSDIIEAAKAVWQEYCGRQNISFDSKRLMITE
ncbi:MAG: hypothetical protein HQK65_01970 [Desulfamplus sp.]|nr:hypothetical protein [Desulfamplus sp.]